MKKQKRNTKTMNGFHEKHTKLSVFWTLRFSSLWKMLMYKQAITLLFCAHIYWKIEKKSVELLKTLEIKFQRDTDENEKLNLAKKRWKAYSHCENKVHACKKCHCTKINLFFEGNTKQLAFANAAALITISVTVLCVYWCGCLANKCEFKEY